MRTELLYVSTWLLAAIFSFFPEVSKSLEKIGKSTYHRRIRKKVLGKWNTKSVRVGFKLSIVCFQFQMLVWWCMEGRKRVWKYDLLWITQMNTHMVLSLTKRLSASTTIHLPERCLHLLKLHFSFSSNSPLRSTNICE